MFKNKFYKYFAIETFKIFFIILFAFTSIAWTVRAVNFLDLVVENGHSFITYTKFSLLNITGILTKFIPFSFLTALILSISKFERQNHFLIVWMTGVKKIEITNLILKLSFLVLLIQILFAVFITPYALNKSRHIIGEAGFASFSSVTKPNTFNDSIKGLTIYFETLEKGKLMKNVLIKDSGKNLKNLNINQNTNDTVIIAKSGLLKDENLILYSGVIQSLDEKNRLYNITFDKILINNSGNFDSRSIVVPKLQETLTSQLLYCVINQDKRNESICPREITSEVIETLSRRIGMPLYIPLLALISCFLLVKRKKFNLQVYIFYALGMVAVVGAEVLVRYSGLSFNSFVMYFLIPIILGSLIYAFLYKNLKYEKI